jgi:hypothetical protein
LNIARDRIGGHDQCGVERVDVLLVTDPFAFPTTAAIGRNFGETEIVRNAGEAVTQNMRRYITKIRLSEQLFPMVAEHVESTCSDDLECQQWTSQLNQE